MLITTGALKKVCYFEGMNKVSFQPIFHNNNEQIARVLIMILLLKVLDTKRR